jgi:conjugative transfer region lipoprotein (TIGR03751 family)
MNKLIMPARLLLISVLLSFTSGCVSSSNKEAILPQTGPTMKDVYDRHFQGGGEGSRASGSHSPEAHSPMGKARPLGDDVTDLKGYTRESYNETRLVFNRLPNPDLVMYVFPHLSGSEGSPIPGYTTAFPFYETVQYALPGEVEGE